MLALQFVLVLVGVGLGVGLFDDGLRVMGLDDVGFAVVLDVGLRVVGGLDVGLLVPFVAATKVTTTTDVTTIDALKLVAKVVFCEAFQSSRRKYRGTGMYKTVSKPLAHLNFLIGVNCYDIGSNMTTPSTPPFLLNQAGNAPRYPPTPKSATTTYPSTSQRS